MATTKKNIDFTYDGVKYKGIEAYAYSDTNISVTVTGTSKMIRQWVDSKYPKFAGRGICWVKSRKFAGGDAIDVYFNRIPDEYINKIIKELDIFEYYDGHNYKRGSIDTSLGTISVGTKYLHVSNSPPYDSKEKNEPAPDWEKILKNATPTTSSGRSNFEWGELIKECAGWKLYVKPYQDTYVYNLVKDKETPQNRQNWGEIQGEITTQTGFKWTKKTQTFSKWGLITDIPELTKKLCDILLKYYTPQNTPTPQTNTKDKFEVGDRFNFLSVDTNAQNVVFVVDRIEDENVYIYREGQERSSSFNWTPIQTGKEFIKDGMVRFLEPASSTPTPEPTPTSNRKFKVGDKFIIDIDKEIVFEVSSIKDSNIYLNWTTRGGDKIKDFLWVSEINAKNEFLDKGRVEFIDEPSQTTPTTDKASIEKKINAITLVLKYAKTDEERKIAQNKINALNITLKYKK